MYKEALRPVWAEINLTNLDYNIKQIKDIKAFSCETNIEKMLAENYRKAIL